MATSGLLLGSLLLLPLFSTVGAQVSSNGGSCRTLNNSTGRLICINGKCNDDPDVGTHICSSGGGRGGDGRRGGGRGGLRGGGRGGLRGGGRGGSCTQFSTLQCGSQFYSTYRCSPPVTSATPAILTNNDFSEGGDGGAASECDERFHSNSERIVALSTGWYNKGSRCLKMIRITASNGRSTTAKVVSECDSMNGCDKEHAGQPPCRNNVVDASAAVWNALGLNIDDQKVPITWTMA